MKPFKPITIVGGGLAGLTLGIGLRQEKVPVVVREQGQYPRHRVCGEFISGRGQETLRRLGLLDLLLEAGAHQARTAAFFSEHKECLPHVLPQPALCLSRFKLDALLAERFKELGGELHCGARVPKDEVGEGTVRACGRRAQVGPDREGWRWFGIKVHARRVTLTSDLELHARANGYVGLCRLQDGKVNVCGLFRHRQGGADSAQNPRLVGTRSTGSLTSADSTQSLIERLRGLPGSILYERLETAQFEEDTFRAVGGLDLLPRRAASSPECCIGDSLTMVPPFTGNGMSIAFESAELGLDPLAAYARGEVGWEAARQVVARDADAAFATRLRWAKWLQQWLLWPSVQTCLLPVVLRSNVCWRFLFWATR